MSLFNIKKREKVFVALSGGVDSSVTALILKRKGYDVSGVFMRCYNIDGSGAEDEKDARSVASHIGIPFYTFDFEEEYKERVVHYMIEGYKMGITPNPDVECNREIKFGLFLERAVAMGATRIATGHYIRLKKKWFGGYSMYTAEDKKKDQSYFLWTLTQNELSHCIFPIGGYKKSEVREIARKANLPNADKKDSQGICFLGKFSFIDFLARHIKEKEGVVVNTRGEKVGVHKGAWFYTRGQRHIGMREGGTMKKRHNPNPYYVVKTDVSENTVTVAEGRDAPELYGREISLFNVNIVRGRSVKAIRNILVQTRYNGPKEEARVEMKPKAMARVRFYKPSRTPAPGQSAVFYTSRGELMGGGVVV